MARVKRKAFLLSVLWLYSNHFETWILIYNRKWNTDELRTQSSFQTNNNNNKKSWRSFYNINNSYIFWEREKLFSEHPSMSCYKEKKQRCLANRRKSIKSWISHFLPIEPNFPGKIFPKNPDTLRDSEGPPLLRIRPKVGGWEAKRQRSPWKKETLLVGLGSHCWGQPLDPRNKQGCRLECSISSESFDGVIGGRSHFVFVSGQCFPRNLFCWKIAKQLCSEALGWLFCQTQSTSKGLLRTTAAAALSPPLPMQLLQTEQDLACHLK